MPDSFDEDFDASQVGPAALLRLEIRYMRRDVSELKDEVRRSLMLKADKTEVASVNDHEMRLRILERRLYWATGFGAAIGAALGGLTHVLLK